MLRCKIVADTNKADKMGMFLEISIRKLRMCLKLILLNFHKQLDFHVAESWGL